MANAASALRPASRFFARFVSARFLVQAEIGYQSVSGDGSRLPGPAAVALR
jgi:hypothetical protein